jgi:hypothetical protein
VLYFSEYEDDCSQVSDAALLGRFRAISLENEIRLAAVQRTMQRRVQAVDGPVKATQGAGIFEFMDDEWVPSLSLVSPASDKPIDPLLQAVSVGDVTSATELLRRGVSDGARNVGIWRALVGGNPCMVRLLLKTVTSPSNGISSPKDCSPTSGASPCIRQAV